MQDLLENRKQAVIFGKKTDVKVWILLHVTVCHYPLSPYILRNPIYSVYELPPIENYLLPQISWLIAHGSWLMAHGSWLMAHGSWLMAHGLWLMAHGSWLMAHGSWLMAHGSWLM